MNHVDEDMESCDDDRVVECLESAKEEHYKWIKFVFKFLLDFDCG